MLTLPYVSPGVGSARCADTWLIGMMIFFGPVHLLLVSANELGFAWDGDERGWVRAAFLPLGMLSGPIQHFQSAIFEAWQPNASAQLADRQGFRESSVS